MHKCLGCLNGFANILCHSLVSKYLAMVFFTSGCYHPTPKGMGLPAAARKESRSLV